MLKQLGLIGRYRSSLGATHAAGERFEQASREFTADPNLERMRKLVSASQALTDALEQTMVDMRRIERECASSGSRRPWQRGAAAA